MSNSPPGAPRSPHRPRRLRFNARARRPWTAAAVGAAVFTPMFWLSVATGVGRLSVSHGHELGAYPVAVVSLYLAAIIVIGPLLAFTVGYALDRSTAAWRKGDAVVMFVALGVMLAAASVSLVMAFAPDGGAFVAALWLFGLPLPVTLGVTRLVMDSVLISPKWTRAAVAVACAPVLLAALVVLGIYVGHATIPA